MLKILKIWLSLALHKASVIQNCNPSKPPRIESYSDDTGKIGKANSEPSNLWGNIRVWATADISEMEMPPGYLSTGANAISWSIFLSIVLPHLPLCGGCFGHQVCSGFGTAHTTWDPVPVLWHCSTASSKSSEMLVVPATLWPGLRALPSQVQLRPGHH